MIECVWVLRPKPVRALDTRLALAAMDVSERRRYLELSWPRRDDFLVGRLLLRRLGAARFSIEPGCVRVSPTATGSIVVEGVTGSMYASISHDARAVAVAISSEPIGLDVASYARRRERQARRFFHPAEERWLRDLSDREGARARATLWAIKEAICKSDGEGLRFPLPSVSVPLRGSGISGGVQWHAEDLGTHVLALSSQDGAVTDFSYVVRRLRWPELSVADPSRG